MKKTIILIASLLAGGCIQNEASYEILIYPDAKQHQKRGWNELCEVPYRLINRTDNDANFDVKLEVNDQRTSINFKVPHNSNKGSGSNIRHACRFLPLAQATKENTKLLGFRKGCPIEGISDKECMSEIQITVMDGPIEESLRATWQEAVKI